MSAPTPRSPRSKLGGDEVLALDADTWGVLRGSRLALDLLEVIELAGVAAGVGWLERRGLGAALVASGQARREGFTPSRA